MTKKLPNNELERIANTTMADVVEIRLREYLKTSAFKPGDALPKEIELANSLGVSRNVVREALSRLRMLGMVETKKKRGMVLARPDILGSFERVLDPAIIDEHTLRDLFELRLTLEVGLADLLYLRKTAKDIAELEQIAKSQKVTGDKQTFRIQHEIAFHGKLYQMTGNDTMSRFQSMLLPVFGYLVTLEKKPIIGKVSHLDLVKILKEGTKEEFRQGMLQHLEHHFKKIQ
ncbi:FadR/GntR family transcriptional regulator [Deminuibacter soli]|uniref:FadR family transcriptional regulator n=1 Tax=Deminuibacter soli TaxID=2291815 RepID=A0A3E1NI67_9BACT|nr:GntR family transcriptional regulator [Deminuibacter soli]RFM27478.1 FadR family transcriptional regulator [Deminuibacter soli]